MLIIFGGLPGAGKTMIARELARQLGGVYLRIDSIEHALRDSGALHQPLNDAGYRVGYAVAEDNLRLGQTVIADSVNPLELTRRAWLDVASRAQSCAVEVEVKCSDSDERRRRIETRTADIPGLRLPAWDEVLAREYHCWDGQHLVIDTAVYGVEESVKLIRERLGKS